MSNTSYKVTITKTGPANLQITGGEGASVAGIDETVIFSQTFDELNVQSLIRDINRTPRKRRSSKKDVASGS